MMPNAAERQAIGDLRRQGGVTLGAAVRVWANYRIAVEWESPEAQWPEAVKVFARLVEVPALHDFDVHGICTRCGGWQWRS